MSKVTKVIAYSNKPLDFLEDIDHVTYANPQFFAKPVVGAKYFWSDKEHIIAAYTKAGVEPYPVIGDVGSKEPVPADWREMSWPKMRSLASDYTDQPVKDKTFAIQVIESAESKYGVVEVDAETVDAETVDAETVANETVEESIIEDDVTE